MSTNSRRQLASILFADIQGYTALMQKDEQSASMLLRHFQKQLEEKVVAHNGRIVSFYGDGALCIFQVPIAAVQCAMDLQSIFRGSPKTPVRMGLHSGTVTLEGNKIFGDSVNITSRIESMGIPEGILMSKKVRDEIKNNPDLELQSLGKFEFKNVEEPIEVFALANEGYVVPKASQLAGKFKSTKNRTRNLVRVGMAAVLLIALGWFGRTQFQPLNASTEAAKTIAVLPFTNLSIEEGNDFYAAGVHEDILNKLAGLKELKVISRTSVAKYQKSKEGLKAIGRRLGASYIVEGSVMRMDEQVRVRARLFDATSEESLWSEEYSGSLSEVFGLQSTIAQEITNTLNTKISNQEQDQLTAVLTRTPKAYDNFIKARTIMHSSFVPYEKLKQAIGLLEKALQADDRFSEGWALLAIAQSQLFERESEFDNNEESVKSIAKEAEKALEKAQQLNPESAASLRATGYFQHKVQQDEIGALRSFDQALAIKTDDFETLTYQGAIYAFMGKLKPAIKNLETAHELNNDDGMVNWFLVRCYEFNRQYEKIPAFMEKLLRLEPEKTHYAVQAKYFQFLADGTLESFHAFENAVRTVEKTEKCDTRLVQDNQAIIAMINGEFESYARFWSGKWDQHHASHGNWSCPYILNDEANQARLLTSRGDHELAQRIVETARQSSTRPVNEKSVCIFDKTVLEPKLTFLGGGDSIQARRNFERMVPKVLSNNRFPRGAVEKMVLLQTADLVAPDWVYDIYQDVVDAPVSIVGMEAVCADPFTYPNLLKHPEFLAEVRADGRFVHFLEHYALHQRGLFQEDHHHKIDSLEGYFFR